MVSPRSLVDKLQLGSGVSDLDADPSKEDIRTVVKELQSDGLCGRRISEQRLGPAFISSNIHGQREIDLLEEVLEEEFEGSKLCVRTRQSECSRLRGGCQGER
jgi:hypothetical protein